MLKQITFSGYDRSGPHIFPIEADVERTIGHIKMARPLPPVIEQYIKTAQPIPGKTQLLIDAMGAGEYYGSNVNGDYFPEEALAHRGSDYGFETFMHYAYPFKHHVNKDPARAYGEKVKLSAYDPHMHRVLLIVIVDDMKCQDILGDLAKNHYWDVSMGCKVPWDECSICHTRARNRAEYCPHLRYQMNKILNDGRRVFAFNRLPKFFDISFVTIGAEKASHVLQKVAQAGQTPNVVLSADIGAAVYGKNAAQSKRAEIEKDVPSQPAANIQGATPDDKAKLVSFMDDAGEAKPQEQAIAPATLNQMAQQPLGDVFSTLSSLGIGLRPEEFQRIVLVNQGAAPLADKLAAHRMVFDERDAGGTIPGWAKDFGNYHHGRVSEKVAHQVAPYMAARSCYPEPLFNRLQKMASKGGYDRNSQWFPMTEEGKRKSSGIKGLGPMSIALATGFLVFRRAFPGLIAKSPTPVKLLAANPWLLPVLVGAGVGASVGISNMSAPMPLTAHGHGTGLDGKNTGAYHGSKTASVMHLGTLPLAYISAGNHQRQWRPQERIKMANSLVALRPELYSAGMFPKGSPRSRELLKVGSVRFDNAIIQSARQIAKAKGN
jgi:hypothetical protein